MNTIQPNDYRLRPKSPKYPKDAIRGFDEVDAAIERITYTPPCCYTTPWNTPDRPSLGPRNTPVNHTVAEAVREARVECEGR